MKAIVQASIDVPPNLTLSDKVVWYLECAVIVLSTSDCVYLEPLNKKVVAERSSHMKFNHAFSLPLFVALMFTGCGGLSQVNLSREPLVHVPANYIDARSAKSKHSFESGTSSYYGDDYLTPSLPELFFSHLYRELGVAIGEKRVILERADVTVTLPQFSYPLQGGPLMLLTEPKYVRVDLSGHVGDIQFAHGITNKVYAGPSDGDIRKTVDSTVQETVTLIRQKIAH